MEYTEWMANEVVIGFLREIREMIRTTRDVPMLFNDTSLLSKREWRNRAIPVVDGFMFEAAETPEDKLFNLQLGHSTGKVIWTYVGTHTQYNREHMKNDRVRGWFSYPVESQELLLDGATALAGGAGVVYWGLSRFFYMPEGPLSYESGRYVKENLRFLAEASGAARRGPGRPVAGVLVSDQTIDWFTGKHYVSKAYENYYHGAWQVMKDLGYDAEPFLDYLMTPEQLARYRLVYAAERRLPQRRAVRDAARLRHRRRHADRHAPDLASPTSTARCARTSAWPISSARSSRPSEPVEIPDLYLKLPGGELIPQDPQVLRFTQHRRRRRAGRDHRPRTSRQPRPGHRAAHRGQGHGDLHRLRPGSGLRGDAHEAPARVPGVADRPGAGARTGRTRSNTDPGVMPQLMASRDTILLHLVADTGNKTKKLRMREEFLPVDNVKVRVRVPDGRSGARAYRCCAPARSSAPPRARAGSKSPCRAC